MAQIVLACGTSHTPLLAMDGADWEARARNDRSNQRLIDTSGQVCSYDDLAAKIGERYAHEAVPERWIEHAQQAQTALDRLARDLEQAAPDVVVVIGDDEHELFSAANMPAIALFYGETAITREFARAHDPRTSDPDYAWMQDVARGYGMDRHRTYPVASQFARELIEHLTDLEFDVAALDAVPDPAKAGFGHAYGFVQTRLFGDRNIPVVPVMLNTYYPPNQPTPARCYDFGRALRTAIERSAADLRVAVIASGGLSHFVTHEYLDRQVLDALENGRGDTLRSVPTHLLNAGSSEIRNWIALGGVLQRRHAGWCTYIPIYRTPAGTGIGLAFASWSMQTVLLFNEVRHANSGRK
jgi:Catalytic LigB subunit of aromatic ring-opening dioxygenase